MIPLCRSRRIFAAIFFLFGLSAAHGDELREAYLKAHPFEAENLEKIQKLKDAKSVIGADPASMEKVLDGLFDGGVKKGEDVPSVSSMPGGASGLSPATQADEAASVIGAAVPKTPAIRFVSQKPKNFILSALWRLKGGAQGEKAYFNKIMEGFNTKTESAILDQLARHQERFASAQAALIREAEEELSAAREELARAERQNTSEDLLKIGRENIEQMRLNKEWIEKRSPEVLVSFEDFSDTTEGEAGWEAEPAADGKNHVRVSFHRRLVPFYLPGAPKSVIEKGRKLAAHELSHAVDNLNPEGQPEGVTEPEAYLKAARSFKEEGQPRGRNLEQERNSFLELRTDLLGWMTRHLSSQGYMEDGGIWGYPTIDDIRDPEAGLRWRLRLIYFRVTKSEENRKEITKKLELEKEVQMALETVIGDPGIAVADKPGVFVERAALAPQCREWVSQFKEMNESQAQRILKAQKAFWREYAEFIAEP